MAKIYPVGLVGEQHYQDTVQGCDAGERVFICHEHDNPHDPLALCVRTRTGATIGYVPRDSWLRAAIHEEGRGVTATILEIRDGLRDFREVVLNATLSDDDVAVVTYRPAPSQDAFTVALRKVFGGR